MSDVRRGYVLLIQGGDPELSGALKGGVMTALDARKRREGKPAEARGRRLTAEERAEVARRVKREIGNTKDATDYALMRTAAEQEYRPTVPGPLRRAARAALGVYGLAIYMATQFIAWEESRWQA